MADALTLWCEEVDIHTYTYIQYAFMFCTSFNRLRHLREVNRCVTKVSIP